MKLVIYKYELRPQGDFTLQLPLGCQYLKVDVQNNKKPMLWVLCDPLAQTTLKKFRVILTGEARHNTDFGTYIDTFLLYKGDFVGHLFDVTGG